MELILYSLLTALFWGISPIALKQILHNVDTKLVFIINSFFYTCCIIIYTIYYWNHVREQSAKIKYSDIYKIALVSVILSFIPNLIYFYLLKNHNPSVVSALVNSAPIFTVAISFYIMKENINFIELIGIIFISLGIVLISITNKN
jgi:drug/metabolite transporter (DMT)-like permease